MKYVLAIAIEAYKDPLLKHVSYALNDANAFIEAWKPHGFTKEGQFILLGDDATKTMIESCLRRMQKDLREDDELVLYYAGHGFSLGGLNVLTAWDTQFREIEHTSISLAYVVDMLRTSKCSKIKLFLDACHTGVEMDASTRGVSASLSVDALRNFFDSAKHCVAFTACHADEKSYSSGKLKHGIWTFHLLEALKGNAPLALKNGRLLTSNSLQNHLRNEVQRTVRETVTGGPPQNPWMFGGADSEFLVADLTPILAARAVKPQPAERHLPSISFHGDNRISVKRLSGWKPTHRVPIVVDGYTRDFVEKIGAGDVQQDLDETYATIRDTMDYKRRDLSKNNSGSGGTIITPDFDYNVTLQQDADDPGQAILRREVTHIRNAQAVMSDAFQDAFAGMFNTIEFDTPKKIKVSDLIDWIENVEPEGIQLVDYDSEGTYCQILLDGVDTSIRIESDSILVVARSRVAPRALANLFAGTWSKLTAVPTALLPGPEEKDDE